jgi:hypothetical protein
MIMIYGFNDKSYKKEGKNEENRRESTIRDDNPLFRL